MIPAFIVEEHNEAFYVWKYALKKGLIENNNTLLHFDDHADLRAPVLKQSLNNLDDLDLQAIKDFTFNELKIDTFILPAVYLSIITNIYWIKFDVTKNIHERIFVRSYNDEGKKIISHKYFGSAPELNDIVICHLTKSNLSGFSPSDDTRDFLIDIDLDFFSCCKEPYFGKNILIEITESEYLDFNKSPYHELKFLTANIEAIEYKNSYFYAINNYKEIYPSEREVSQQEIGSRIDQFVSVLNAWKICPRLITICRSRHSGFTPAHQWRFIEDTLLSKLSDLYSLNIEYLTQPQPHNSLV